MQKVGFSTGIFDNFMKKIDIKKPNEYHINEKDKLLINYLKLQALSSECTLESFKFTTIKYRDRINQSAIVKICVSILEIFALLKFSKLLEAITSTILTQTLCEKENFQIGIGFCLICRSILYQ